MFLIFEIVETIDINKYLLQDTYDYSDLLDIYYFYLTKVYFKNFKFVFDILIKSKK